MDFISNDVIMCRRGCGNPAMLRKNGKPVNGLCNKCLRSNIGKNPMKKKKKKSKVNSIYLDFSSYPDILKDLQDCSLRNIRTIEEQAIFFIKQGLAETRIERKTKEKKEQKASELLL